MRALVWFRSDLRVGDNAALHRAASVSTRGVIGIFLIAAEQWDRHDWAGCRVEFMMRCVRALSAQLAGLNIPLLIARADRFDEAPRVIASVAKKHACDAVHFNIEYEVNESRRDDAVQRALAKEGIAVHAHHDQAVFPPGSIRTGQGTFYTVFTPYKNAWLKRAAETEGVRVFAKPRKQDAIGVASDAAPEVVKGFELGVDARAWPAGEQHALKRLGAFVQEKIRAYASDRDAPSLEGTSGLSPYLAVGAISPRQCLAAASESNRGRLDGTKNGATAWISEIIWREFYRHIVVGYPRVCMHRPFKIETDRLRWRDDDDGFAAWCEGRTGFPIVDAGMRQLRRTGWMHNRVRMIVAMFLTKDLFLDWRRGERFFMRHLVDGDLANNNGGWQWSASTGTDAAPYFRIFNPASQSKANDPRGAYIREHVPELASVSEKEIHDPSPLTRERTGYPMPIVDHGAAREQVIAAFKALA